MKLHFSICSRFYLRVTLCSPLVLLIIVVVVGLEEFNKEDAITEEEDDVQYDDKDGKEDIDESANFIPWYVTAVKGLIDVKEEVEDDLMCDVKTTPATSNIFMLARCKQKLKAEAEITYKMLQGQGRCTVEVWTCFSTVMEGMVKHVDNLKDMFGLLSQSLYKITFHGTHKNIWISVLEIPEVVGLARCARDHDQCVMDRIMAEVVHSEDRRDGIV